MHKDIDGFDTLLRPVHDAITTNWEKTIKSYLEKYLEHLYNLHTTNFSEAAMILQNSVKFYSKRIELLYSDLLNFIMYINDAGPREEGAEGQATKKGRRCVKSFQNDDLKVLNNLHQEHNIDLNVENIGKNGTGKKSVILNPSVKIPIKSGRVSQIFQSDGKELGYKDEFRLFWPLFSSGLLSEDFHFGEQCMQSFISSILEECNANSNDSVCANDISSDMIYDNDMDLGIRVEDQPPSTNEPPDLGPVSPSFTSPPTPDTDRNELPKKMKADKGRKKPADWAPISFNFVLPLRKLGTRKVFKLPRQLIVDELEGRTKRKRKSEFDEDVNDVLVMSHILYQNELMDGTCGGLKVKCNLEKRNKKNLMQKSRTNRFMVNEDDIKAETDEDCADDFFCDDEVEADATSPVPLQLNGITDIAEDRDHVDAVLYLDSAFHIIAKYNTIRRKISMKATELARRVSEWHESIMPALEAAESRSIFNVHEYGTKILDIFSDNDTSSVVQFDNFVQKQPREEICRFLLASLMLANTYNVEIIKSNDQELAKDCLKLRLLSKVRHHDLLNENIGATAADSNC